MPRPFWSGNDQSLLNDSGIESSGLQRWFESITEGLRRTPPRLSRHLLTRLPWNRDAVIPVQVDLVGDTGHRRRLSIPPHQPIQPSQQVAGSLAAVNPFRRPSEAPSDPAGHSSALIPTDPSQPWSFRETVLLRPTGRSSRVLLYTALGFTGVSLAWLVFAPLDQTVALQGKLEPDSRVKSIQAAFPGTVDAVLVDEGEQVQAGQLLLRFDLREVRSRLESAESVRQRLLDQNRVYAIALGDNAGLDGLTANQAQQLRSQASDLSSRREAALQDFRRSEARLAGLQQSLVTMSDIAARYDHLARSGAVSEVQKLESQAKADELKSRINEEQRDQARLSAQLNSSSAGPDAELRGRIEENLRQVAQLEGQIREARLQIQSGELRAPTSGTVFNLEARRGTVAQAAQPLLKLVPKEILRARVYLPSSSVGFVHAGQSADISLDTFPSSDYGRIPATVERVSTDALASDEQKITLGTEASGLHYPVILRLSRQTLQAGSRQVPLQPGMGLTADIHLRQRRMLQVFTGFFEDKLRSLERMR